MPAPRGSPAPLGAEDTRDRPSAMAPRGVAPPVSAPPGRGRSVRLPEGPAKEQPTALPGEATVEKSCPDCGAETGFVEHAARILQGTCSGCGKTFTILEGAPAVSSPSAGGPVDPAGGTGTSGASLSSGAPAGPPCSVCGAALAVRASDTGLEARCSSCSTTFTYVLATSPFPGPGRAYPSRGRPAPREEAGRFGPPRSRPCRECGGPLRFTTEPDGNVTGECDSCGNRFTLPPRREFGGGRDGGDRRRPGRGGPPSFRRGGRYPSARGGGDAPRFRSGGPPYRRRERREESDDEDDSSDRRRRRPRRE